MSRPLRGQERGYRRLTVGVSLVLLCAGLALTARDTYRVMEYQNDAALVAACREHAASESKRMECGGGPDPALSRPFSAVFDVLLTLAMWGFYPDTTALVGVASMGDHLLALTIALGIAVSLILAAVPWVVFYSVRWVARGFDGAA